MAPPDRVSVKPEGRILSIKGGAKIKNPPVSIFYSVAQRLNTEYMYTSISQYIKQVRTNIDLGCIKEKKNSYFMVEAAEEAVLNAFVLLKFSAALPRLSPAFVVLLPRLSVNSEAFFQVSFLDKSSTESFSLPEISVI